MWVTANILGFSQFPYHNVLLYFWNTSSTEYSKFLQYMSRIHSNCSCICTDIIFYDFSHGIDSDIRPRLLAVTLVIRNIIRALIVLDFSRGWERLWKQSVFERRKLSEFGFKLHLWLWPPLHGNKLRDRYKVLSVSQSEKYQLQFLSVWIIL